MSDTVVVIEQVSTVVVEPDLRQVVVAAPGPQGPVGPIGPPGGAIYEHVQAVPASQWNMPHGLGHKPHVTLIGIDGVVFLGRIEHPDDDNAIAVLNQPVAGIGVLS